MLSDQRTTWFRDQRFLLNPPVRERRVLADDVQELAAPLEEAARAVARVAGEAQVEGLLLPPRQHVALGDPGVGERQRRIGLAVAGRGAVIDQPGAVGRVPVVLDSDDRHAPGGGAGVDEVERLAPLQPGVRVQTNCEGL